MTSNQLGPAVRKRARSFLSKETTGGALLLGAAVLALLWANSPWGSGYQALAEIKIGPAALDLELSLRHWAADGLLALFFFQVGAELKQEFRVGSLSRPREAAVPVLAAVGGMIAPAILFVTVVTVLGDTTALHGWAIPVATDIAFATAVLAVFGRGLPLALRTFLLTLAVVDDLLGIVVIAIFYTAGINLLALFAALLAVVAFALLVRLRRLPWWLLIPVAIVAWGFMHNSGVHATIAGVLLGFMIPAKPMHGEEHARTERFADGLRPLIAAIVLPLFSFFSAGVAIGGDSGSVFDQPVVPAIIIGLVAGKFIGVLGTTFLVTRLTPLEMVGRLRLSSIIPVGFLTGIGFTVSLLIAELSYTDSAHADGGKIGVLAGSLVAACLAAIALTVQRRRQKR